MPRRGVDPAFVDLAISTIALTAAIARRPWRAIAASGPPWAWVLVLALLPLWWSIDHQLGVAVLPPLSGAALLVLMAGWPLAVLLCVPIGLITVLGGPLDAYDALHRAAWLGIVPRSSRWVWAVSFGAGCPCTWASMCLSGGSSAPVSLYGWPVRSVLR